MEENNRPSTSGTKRLNTFSKTLPERKILRLEDNADKEEITAFLMASDESDTENDIFECLISEEKFLQAHKSDDENEELLSGEDESNEQSSGSSDDNTPLTNLSKKNYYYGKNRFKWSTNPPSSKSTRTPQHNIVPITSTSSLLSPADEKDVFVVWSKIFDDDMRQNIIMWTNKKIAQMRIKYKRDNRSELKDVDIVELNAFLGLLYYSAVLKSNHESSQYIFSTDGTGCEIFRCVLSETRFLILLFCLRFDNPLDRSDRLKTDKLAAISFLFNRFVENSNKLYRPGESVTVDEMLVKFRGRSHLISYMPKKLGKYGLIIRALCDSKSFYFYNGYIYSGKGSDGIGLTEAERKFLVPTQCVLRLTKPLQGSNRNITADNWFSSVELVEALSKRKLTYVGTMKKNKREIPIEFQPHRNREVQSTLFGFTKDKTLCSFVPKQNKSVVLISSMHHDDTVDNDTRKPEIIEYYNSTKGGVDETDKKCSIYSCSRRTKRWPMVVFYRILDLYGVNAFILHNQHAAKELERGDFIKKLARSLVLPQMKRRVINTKLPKELRTTLTRVLGSDRPSTEHEAETLDPGSRKTCKVCPPKFYRKTTHICVGCNRPVCLQCSKPLCTDCQ